jgi:hypothetical protein
MTIFSLRQVVHARCSFLWLSLSAGLFAACDARGPLSENPNQPPLEHLSATFQGLKLQRWPGFEVFCPLSPEAAEIVFGSRHFSWSLCNRLTNPVSIVSGARTITQAEISAIGVGLSKIAISHAKSCGDDMDVVALDVTTVSSTELYVDDFYSDCPGEIDEGRTFVTGLNDLWILVGSLASK